MTFNACSFFWISCLLLVSYDFREDLRKWFLSMETTLFRYRFRRESSETQVGFLFLLILCFLFYLHAHWLYIMLLNWQRALMAEFDLPCKAVSSAEFEVVIFHWFIVNTCQQILLFSCKHLKSHANDWYTSSYNSLNLFCLLIMQWMRFSNVLTML